MSGKTKIVSGMRIGKLTISYASGRSNDGHQLWACICDCGEVVIRQSNNLCYAIKHKHAAHCGCTPPKSNLSHGMRYLPEYKLWQGIKNRCLKSDCKDYLRYGPLGMDKTWQTDFQAFFAHIGPRPSPKMQIDRIDNRVGYFYGNVRWASIIEQARNKRSTYFWYIGDKKYETCQEAANDHRRTLKTVHRWFAGEFDARRGYFVKPRPDCRREKRYA